jgi:hypothetical protein
MFRQRQRGVACFPSWVMLFFPSFSYRLFASPVASLVKTVRGRQGQPWIQP